MNGYGQFLVARTLVHDQRSAGPYSPYRFERQEEDRESVRTGVATAAAVLAYVVVVLVVLAAISLGERIYAEKPKRFTKRLQRRWATWREREPVAA